MKLLVIVCSLLVGPAKGQEFCRLSPVGSRGWVLRNERIARRLPRPQSLPAGAELWPVGARGIAFEDHGFLIHLEDGVELKPRDCTWRAEPIQVKEGHGLRVEFMGEARSAGLTVVMEYSLSPGESWLRKRLRLAADRSVVVRDVEVERLQVGIPTDLGGFGQPVFVGRRAFVGLEYPAAENLRREGWVILQHHPGVRLKPRAEGWFSKSAVMGMGHGRDASAAFAQYLAQIRRPPKPLVVYNSWYDVQRGEMSVPVLLERARQLHQELTVKRGAPFDVVVLDDGWQDVQSIWEIDKRGFPNGFRELHEELEALGMRLGLWHPLTATNGNLDTAWGAANGYEVSPDKSFFCLSGPKYNAALRDVLRRHVTEYEIAYFKHDFNAFACAGAGHGHLPEATYGLEANVDAEIETFAYLRELNKDIYLNPSGGMWLSPWWLRHVDTVWMQHCADFGYNKHIVAYEPRDWEMTYRDTMLWQNLHKDRAQFPISAIMTIGIIDGKLNRLGGEHEPLDRWANNVMVNVGRGSLLQELYVTPSLFSEQQWDILAAALKWQRQYVRQMAQGRMLSDNPAAGHAYGFVHMDASGGFVCLRNPGIVGQATQVALPELPPEKRFAARRVYPWLQDLELRRDRNRWVLESALEPFGVTIVEIMPPDVMHPRRLPGTRCSVASRASGRVTYDVWGHPGTEDRSAARKFAGAPCHLWSVRAIDGSGRRFRVKVDEGVDWRFVIVARGLGSKPAVEILLDSVVVEAQRISGEGWELFMCTLPKGIHEAAWTVSESPRGEPFVSPSFRVESFFVREAKLSRVSVTMACNADNKEHQLPMTPHAGIERSTWVGPKVSVEDEQGPLSVAVTERDLSTAKAAKLHIRVFGSQGGADYGRKWILLNDQQVASVPSNSNVNDPDHWETFVLDLSAGQMRSLRTENEVRVRVATSDCFKFTDLALAVQLADGRWAESEHSGDVWCNAPGWLYEEGKTFSGTTPPIRLRFRPAKHHRE